MTSIQLPEGPVPVELLDSGKPCWLDSSAGGDTDLLSLHASWMSQSDAFLVVFDTNDPSSLEEAETWLEKLTTHNALVAKQRKGGKMFSYLLVGTKIDRPREVSEQEAVSLAGRFKTWYKETSSVTLQGTYNLIPILISFLSSLERRGTKDKATSKPVKLPAADQQRADRITEELNKEVWQEKAPGFKSWPTPPEGHGALIECSEGFHFECNSDPDPVAGFVTELVDQEIYEATYKEYLYGRPHQNYISAITQERSELLCISMETPNGKHSAKALLRSRFRDAKILVPYEFTKNATASLQYITTHATSSDVIKYIALQDSSAELLLVDMERHSISRQHKVGVLFGRPGQTEDEMFQNTTGGPSFEKFLDVLGTRVQLKNWTGYRGGLDVKSDTTGTESLYATFADIQVMFHVSTMLPNQVDDQQRVEKKRHLGNDVVMIVFLEGQGRFDPRLVASQFVHVWLVVRPLDDDYLVEVCAKAGVPYSGPPAGRIPAAEFRRWCLHKIVNAERAAMHAPAFAQKIQRTRRLELENLSNIAEGKSYTVKAVRSAGTGRRSRAGTSWSGIAGFELPGSPPRSPSPKEEGLSPKGRPRHQRTSSHTEREAKDVEEPSSPKSRARHQRSASHTEREAKEERRPLRLQHQPNSLSSPVAAPPVRKLKVKAETADSKEPPADGDEVTTVNIVAKDVEGKSDPAVVRNSVESESDIVRNATLRRKHAKVQKQSAEYDEVMTRLVAPNDSRQCK